MKTIKTEKLVSVYALLKGAKLGNIEDEQKIKLVKSVKAIKKVATAFDDFKNDCLEAMKGAEHDDKVKQAQEWQQQEQEGKEVTLSIDERKALNEYFNKYQQLVTDAVKEEAGKDNEVDIRTITEDSLTKLATANDWTIEQIIEVEEIVCE